MRKTKIFLRVSFILLALSCLLFAGCSSGSDDDGPPQSKPVTPISGVQVYDDYAETPSTGNITFTQCESGAPGNPVHTLSGDLGLTDASVGVTSGQLTLNMGTKNVAAGKLRNYADDGLTVTPPSARFYELKEFRDGSGNRLRLLKVEGGQKKEEAHISYATEAANISDSHVSINFGKGWGWLLYKKGASGEDIPYAGNPADLGFKWYIE